MSDFHVESVSNDNPESGIQQTTGCKIRVLGIGGGGCNSLNHMINENMSGVEFIAINTDAQVLGKSRASVKVQIGVKLTGGLGAGCDPNKGRKAAEESRDDIKKLLKGSDMVFITAGMGGGTGTGAAPIIAEIAKEAKEDVLIVAVVTKPFRYEGKRRMVNAESGITELSKHVDSLIVVDNDKLLKNLGANISIVNAFNEADDVLLNAVRGITDSITNPSFINVDFADVKTVMRGRGHAMIGTGVGEGANFVEDAVERAIHSPLIEPVDIQSAAGLLVMVRTNPNFPILKFEQVNSAVQAYADTEADCKFGLTFDDTMPEDQVSVTILITGISTADTVAAETAALRGNDGVRAGVKQNGFYHTYSGVRPGFGTESASKGQVSFSVGQGTQPQQRTENAEFGNTSIPSSVANFTARTVEPEARQPAEVPVGNGSNADDDPSGLWDELPPILRNRAD